MDSMLINTSASNHLSSLSKLKNQTFLFEWKLMIPIESRNLQPWVAFWEKNSFRTTSRSAISFLSVSRDIYKAARFHSRGGGGGKYSLTRGPDCPVGCTGRAQPPFSRKFIISRASLSCSFGSRTREARTVQNTVRAPPLKLYRRGGAFRFSLRLSPRDIIRSDAGVIARVDRISLSLSPRETIKRE